MPYFMREGIKLHYLDEGEGPAILFLHEFGGDARTWKEQLRYFAENPENPRRCIVLSARGYPPSDVPEQAKDYGWQINMRDAFGVMAHLGLTCFDVVGLSMGAYIALMMCLDAPEKIRSCVCASVGSGAHLPTREAFIKDALESADNILKQNKVPAMQMALAPNRIQLRAKNPDAWQTFCDHLGEHPAIGAAHTLAQVQAKRPGLHDFADPLANLDVPVLILAGDEDEPCLDASLWLKRQMPYSGLKLYPRSGHLLNLESPDEFNRDIACFHRLVEKNKWPKRDQTPFLSMFQSDDKG